MREVQIRPGIVRVYADEPKPFPVTDPDLDAPDGAVVDIPDRGGTFERHGGTWEPVELPIVSTIAAPEPPPKKPRKPRAPRKEPEAAPGQAVLPGMQLDTRGAPLAVGDAVRWHGRTCTVLRFDRDYPSLVEIDDPDANQRWAGAKKTERVVRCDEVTKK